MFRICMSYKKIRIQTPTEFVYETDVSLYTKNFETPTVIGSYHLILSPLLSDVPIPFEAKTVARLS